MGHERTRHARTVQVSPFLHVVLCNVTAVYPSLCYVDETRLAPPLQCLESVSLG